MNDFKVGEHVTLILTAGRLVEAEIKAIVQTKQGKRHETARIYSSRNNRSKSLSSEINLLS